MRPTQEDIDYAAVIGRNLSRILKERGVTQAELARRLGIARAGINKYVQGVAAPSPRNIVRIARALGVTTDTLLSAQEALPQGEEWDPSEYIVANVHKLVPNQAEAVAKTVKEFVSSNEEAIALSRKLVDVPPCLQNLKE